MTFSTLSDYLTGLLEHLIGLPELPPELLPVATKTSTGHILKWLSRLHGLSFKLDSLRPS